MHWRDISPGKGPVILKTFRVFVSSSDIAETVILNDQEESNVSDDVRNETPGSDVSYDDFSGGL